MYRPTLTAACQALANTLPDRRVDRLSTAQPVLPESSLDASIQFLAVVVVIRQRSMDLPKGEVRMLEVDFLRAPAVREVIEGNLDDLRVGVIDPRQSSGIEPDVRGGHRCVCGHFRSPEVTLLPAPPRDNGVHAAELIPQIRRKSDRPGIGLRLPRCRLSLDRYGLNSIPCRLAFSPCGATNLGCSILVFARFLISKTRTI